MTALPFLAAILAFGLFGLATDQHHGKRFRRACPRGRATRLRATAWTLLALAFALSMIAWGAVFGAIGWFASIISGGALACAGLNFIPLSARRRRG